MKRAWLRTSEAAQIIGVSTQYIYQEICVSQRLSAQVVKRPPSAGRTKGQASILIYPEQLAAYITAYWPEKLEKWQSVKAQWDVAA